MIKVLPQQGKFTLFLKHPCYLYLREWLGKISDEENYEISNNLKIFLQNIDMRGFPKWYEERLIFDNYLNEGTIESAMFELKKKKGLFRDDLSKIIQSKLNIFFY